jgi:DNA polymerase-3 subunit beta
MKFQIANNQLNQLLHKLQNVVSAKSTIPILSNFLIEAANDELIITATDLTVGMRCFTEAKILEEGATTLPAKKFSQLIRELTTPQVEISTNPEQLTEIVANASRFKLRGMGREEFPSLPDLAGAVQFKIKQQLLKDLLFRVAFAVSREDTRYVLTGVFFQIANSTATFFGTDARVLAKTHTPIEIDPGVQGTFIIPLKAIEEMLKTLKDEGEATIYLMQDKIAVEANQSILITKLLSGEYPEFTRIIPSDTPIKLTLHREELMILLRQVSLFTTDVSQAVRFIFSAGELKLTANAMEIGEGKVSMPVNYSGAPLEIAFSPTAFLEVLRHCKEETFIMGLSDAYNPAIITDGNIESEQFLQASPLYVLMPMRLGD